MTTIVWFRQDLRILDNPALVEAAHMGPVLPVYIWDEDRNGEGVRPLGGASRWWLHHSLSALEKDLGSLVCLRGDALTQLCTLVKEVDAQAVYWNRLYEPQAIRRDKIIKQTLTDVGVEAHSFNGALLHEPWEIETGSGGPYKVYSPFWRAAKARSVKPPLQRPKKLSLAAFEKGEDFRNWGLLPAKPNWAEGWDEIWRPGEAGASEALDRFDDSGLEGYATKRDRPDLPNVSRLSPHLHFGEISPRQLWARLEHVGDRFPNLNRDAHKFLSEVGWREFSYHLLYHFPSLPEENWRSAFDAFPWREDEDALKAWQRGETGYPFVDAGMRELWQTGYMHNRVRMIAASFLIKHLQLHWRHGEAWFWDTLVDADLANNSASWQWVAGSGADAAPYFRIFNPISQGRKFDPDGVYIRRWCPELAKLDNGSIHAPFEVSKEVLQEAGVVIGETYPAPIVDHAAARAAALKGYEAVKAVSGG